MVDDWRPTTAHHNLKLRSTIYSKIRQFFEARGVLEVETPLLCHSTVTDPQLTSFKTSLEYNGVPHQALYLQTSPEFAMKKLLAAGSNSIFQICKAFRNGESGKRHNPEFTLLEWYRVEFDLFNLMADVDDLLALILNTKQAERISYRDLFYSYFAINPHTSSASQLQQVAELHGISLGSEAKLTRDGWLDLLMTHVIEPNLGLIHPVFIYDYPSSQAALAKVRSEENYEVGERFELYYRGMELANGYHELSDVGEQLMRFERDNLQRQADNLPMIPIDTRLLNALPSLPPCSGVALGLDRLICLAANSNDIQEVIAFPISRA